MNGSSLESCVIKSDLTTFSAILTDRATPYGSSNICLISTALYVPGMAFRPPWTAISFSFFFPIRKSNLLPSDAKGGGGHYRRTFGHFFSRRHPPRLSYHSSYVHIGRSFVLVDREVRRFFKGPLILCVWA